MNILILTSIGGSFNSVRPELEIFVSLAKEGHSITIMTQKESAYAARFKEYNIDVIEAKHDKKIDIKNILLAKKIIKEKKIDIVYATASRSISNAIFACMGTDVKLVTYRGTTGGLYRYDPSSYLNALNPRVDGVICVSESVERHVKKQVLSNSKKIVTIYKGHDVSWYEQQKIDLEEFGTNKDNFNIAFVANVRPHKGLIYVIKAAYELSGFKDIHILLIGDKIDKEPYISEIENSGMKEKIHITGFRSDVPQIISACDVLVHASTRKEGLPRVILESLASGTPVIASANESSLEIIEDGVNGFIVPIKDAFAIAEKIKQLYNSPQTLQRLKSHAKDVIEGKMSHNTTVKKYTELLESLCN
ncbi:MAG: glycosyltransferase family 4 protein [Sulfurimonas sp.]|uniref:glycosyltransferase family 4 protein n=1 Tax=Sulfurimonas sp. TaxID=2022749 RepID=UPI0026346988|nr:glycosyltransferase family 4 protein [Sulfurimonas sp.]MDD2653091.1 glycosyltransferase family 4 protein [Sulfurimonas sp.]MDD3452486.1 glycosyltransferase family 4 protein [Sulfurimonas sp.]